MAYEQRQKGRPHHACGARSPLSRNAPTKLMKELDYGKGYQYAHDSKDKLTDMQCLPDSLLGREYYLPTEEGIESRYKARLEEIKAWKKSHANK